VNAPETSARGSVVVKALGLRPEGRGFEARWAELFFFFSIYIILPVALGPGVYSDSDRSEYRKHKKKILGSKVRGADNLTAICEPIA
jgi:hypothetical protein